MTIRISAVIPTFNRAEYLRKAISSLVEQSLSKDQYEIIIVDNCSTDNTRAIVLSEFSHVSNLRYIFEPVQGLNQARNTGWRQAKGEYVAFTDDDAIVATDWLEQILHTFETVAPQAGCVGGPVEPIWEASRPLWLSDDLLPALTVVGIEPEGRPFRTGEWLVGANIAFKKYMLEKLDGFRVGLDRIGSKLLSNGEILIERTLDTKGFMRYYHPEIFVRHHVPASRLNQSWFIRRAYWQGVSESLMHLQVKNFSRSQRWFEGIYRFKQLLVSRRVHNLIMPTQDPVRFQSKFIEFAKLGYAMGMLGLSK